MTRWSWSRSRTLLVLFLAACGGDSTGPDTGSLNVTVDGLPSGTSASVTVTGPGGYSQTLGGSQVLTSLQPGSYTVSATTVSSGDDSYAPAPSSQVATVTDGGTASSSVTYTVSSGSLTVTINGLPAGTDASVLVTGPGGYSRQLTATTTLPGLQAGSYTVTAQPVAAGATQYSGSPPSQAVSVSAGNTAGATVTYAESTGAGLNLRIDGVYLTQSVQTYTGTVPLIAGRDAFLRVFVTATEPNVVSPTVRVRLYQGAVMVLEQTITRLGTTPLAPQEGILSSSWNLAVSKTFLTPGLAMQVEVDPTNTHAETDEGDNVFPSNGLPLPLQVETASAFRVTFIPVTTAVDGRTGNVTAGNRDQYLDATMRMHPLSAFDAAIGAPLTIPATTPALQANNGNNSWNQVLSQLQARRVSDASTRYYYGVVNPAYSSGVAGMGYVGYPAAVGWDKLPSAASVAAHEWGHNWNRQHAPCGSASNPDQQYPYAGGTIGVYGYDIVSNVLKPTTSHDLMGYCNNEWISDYTYQAVKQWRSTEPGVGNGLGAAIQPALVVWGRMVDGQPVLEPAFQVTTRPSLPARPGPYTIEARAADGARVFGLSFAPLEVADDPQGGRHFAFAVPLTPERSARIARLEMFGEAGRTSLARGGDHAPHIQVSPAGAGRVSLQWDAASVPMVVVRDPVTGEILSFARGGRATVLSDRPDLSLSFSNRVGSREQFVRVPGR